MTPSFPTRRSSDVVAGFRTSAGINRDKAADLNLAQFVVATVYICGFQDQFQQGYAVNVGYFFPCPVVADCVHSASFQTPILTIFNGILQRSWMLFYSRD